MDTVRSGLPSIGDLPWGTHFCQFYKTADDLLDSLVPYFKAGLDGNEYCLWVASQPFTADDARAALGNVVPDLAQRAAAGQIEILNHDEWYLRTGKQSADEVLAEWVRRKELALERGYAGLRLTGNTYWLERDDWSAFEEYERKVNATFRHHRIVGLCSYCLGRCSAEEVIDVVRNHEFAVVRRGGDWEVIESASLKVAKEELRRANDELERRVAERTAELRAAVVARDQFLSVASHELKTPLTSLVLHLDSIVQPVSERGISEEEKHRRLHRALDACQRLGRLVDTLLDVARADTASTQVQREEVDLAALVAELLERLAPQFKQARCPVLLEAPRAVLGQWDRFRLGQALTNLFVNAATYAPGAPVRVSVEVKEDTAVIAIADGGPGVPADQQQRIFERFVQLAPSSNPRGFGLGLWLVRQNVEAMGSQVSIDSKPGAGATFVVELPRK